MIIGDNGASAEGDVNGCFNELINLNGAGHLQTAEFMASRIDDFGTPAAYNHYAVGWAHAMNTPYQWTKQVASHWGGTRTGTIVRWPQGIDAAGEVRHQFHHVIDVAPTVLEAAGLPEPTFVHGVQQRPYEGVSMAYTFDDDAGRRAARRPSTSRCSSTAASTTRDGPRSPGTRSRGTRASRCRRSTTTSGSSTAPTTGPRPTTSPPTTPSSSPTCSASSCSRRPSTRCSPSTTGGSSGSTPTSPDGPSLIHGNSQVLFGGMGRLTENVVLNVKNKSHAVTADLTVPDERRERRDRRPGRRLRRLEHLPARGPPAYCYNLFGLQRFHVRADRAVPAGDHQVRLEFTYDGGGSAREPPPTSTSTAPGRHRPHRCHRAAGLLRRRDPRRRIRHRAPRSATTTPSREASSPAGSTASRSTSATTPTTTTTSSPPKNGCASSPPGSDLRGRCASPGFVESLLAVRGADGEVACSWRSRCRPDLGLYTLKRNLQTLD